MAQPQGSGFTNIQNILNANQGNKLGEAVGGGVQNIANQAVSGLNNRVQDFQNKTQQGLQTLGNEKTNEQSVLQDPTKATDQDVSNFANYRGGQYGGPTNLGDTTNLQNQAQNAQQLGQAAGSTSGRLGLLQQFAGGGKQYNSGQQNLDNLLLGSSANNNLNQARRVTTGLVNNVNQAQQNAQGQAATVQGQYQNFGNQVSQDINAQQNPLLQNLTQTATTQQAAKDTKAAQLQQELANGTISAADAQLLGLTNGQTINNVDLNSLLTIDPTKANQQNVANNQQTAQLNALARLGGNNAFSTNPSQAGSFGQNQFKYDVAGLGTEAANAQNNFNSASGTYQNLANQASSGTNNLLKMLSSGGASTGNLTNFNNSLKSFGIDPNDPNAASKLNTIYQQSLNNQYTGPGGGGAAGSYGNYGKDVTEGIFGNQNLGFAGDSERAAILNALNQYNQNTQAVNQLKNQYGIGKTLTVTPDEEVSS